MLFFGKNVLKNESFHPLLSNFNELPLSVSRTTFEGKPTPKLLVPDDVNLPMKSATVIFCPLITTQPQSPLNKFAIQPDKSIFWQISLSSPPLKSIVNKILLFLCWMLTEWKTLVPFELNLLSEKLFWLIPPNGMGSQSSSIVSHLTKMIKIRKMVKYKGFINNYFILLSQIQYLKYKIIDQDIVLNSQIA